MISEILDFNTNNALRIRKSFRATVLNDQLVYHYLMWHLSLCDCKAVAIEDDYIDRDFSEDYSAFYAGTFSDNQKYCYRLHFFSGIDVDELYSLIGFEKDKAKVLAGLEKLQKNYLGFMIILPIPKGKIGRTVIRPSKCLSEHIYITSIAEQRVNIDGVKLTVKGMPFIHQDGQVAVCSSAAIWMVSRFLHLKYKYPRSSLSQITLAANKYQRINREFPAIRGLTVEQIISGLMELGFTPNHYDKDAFGDKWNPKELIYKYIESGLPVIIIIGGVGNAHACVVIGHDYCPDQELILDSKAKLISSSVFINCFIINDDLIGPYLKLPEIQKVTEANKKIFYERTYDDLLSDSVTYAPYSMQSITGVIIPAPKKVYLEPQQIEDLFGFIFPDDSSLKYPFYLTAFISTLSQIYTKQQKGNYYLSKDTFLYATSFLKKINDDNYPFFYRTRFVRSVDLKEDYFFDKEYVSSKLGKIYAKLHMPRYVWLVEITDNIKGFSEEEGSASIIGEFIFDATGSDNEATILSVHFPGLLMLSPDTYPRFYNNLLDGNEMSLDNVSEWSLTEEEVNEIRPLLGVSDENDSDILRLDRSDQESDFEVVDTIGIPIPDDKPYEIYDREKRYVNTILSE